jgi:hypothetical protein
MNTISNTILEIFAVVTGGIFMLAIVGYFIVAIIVCIKDLWKDK